MPDKILLPDTDTDIASGALPAPRGRARPERKTFFLSLLLLFAAVLSLHLIHHFAFDHARVLFAFDGKHYLESTDILTRAIQSFQKSGFEAAWAVLSAPSSVSTLIYDGPIIPMPAALLFALIGREPQTTDAGIYTVMLSLLAAVSSLLVSLLAFRLLRGARLSVPTPSTISAAATRRLAVLAGLLFGLYPTTLVATGVNRSENFSTPLILALALLLCKCEDGLIYLIFAGFTGALLTMTKPALVPAIGLLFLYSAGRSAGRLISGAFLKNIVVLSLAAAVTILPWALYTKAVTGRASITAERQPAYNVAVGTDVEMDGWCTNPESPHVTAHKNDQSPLRLLASQWFKNPDELVVLTLRRTGRLWAEPWNDFRETVFGFGVKGQIAFHDFFLAFGLLGFFVYIFGAGKTVLLERKSRLVGDILVLTILGHLGFVLFQTMGRYGYSAMPLFAALSALGVFYLLVAGKQGLGSSRFLAALGCAAVTLLILLTVESFTRGGEPREIAYWLLPGQTISNVVVIRDAQAKQALVIVDGDSNCASLMVKINGKPLTGTFSPLAQYSSVYYSLGDTMAEHASYMRLAPDCFRQWRAMPIPLSMLNLNGDNLIELESTDRPLTVYGDDRCGALPSPQYFASDRMVSRLENLEPRMRTLQVGGAGKSAALDGKSISGLPRIHIMLSGRSGALAAPVAASTGLIAASRSIPLTPSCFHWLSRGKDSIVVNKTILKAVGALSCAVPCVMGWPASMQARVHLGCQARCKSGPGRLGLALSLTGLKNQNQRFSLIPDYVDVGKDWTQIALSDSMPLGRVGGRSEKLFISLFPCSCGEAQYGPGKNCSDFEVRNLSLTVDGPSTVELAGCEPTVY